MAIMLGNLTLQQIQDRSGFRFPQEALELLQNRQEECKSLWVFTDNRECISCWKLSFKQRLSALFFGIVWLSVLSGGTQPPVWLDCTRTVFKKEGKANGD